MDLFMNRRFAYKNRAPLPKKHLEARDYLILLQATKGASINGKKAIIYLIIILLTGPYFN